jgi:hypothetical protein
MKTKYCRYCGEAYDPNWNAFHGENHIFFRTAKYDEETGKLIE